MESALLKKFALLGYRNGTISIQIEFQEGESFPIYLQAQGINCSMLQPFIQPIDLKK